MTNVKAEKISGFTLELCEMVLASFYIKDELGKACFFSKTFLVTAIKVNIILKKSFLTFNNANIVFAN